MAHFITLTTAGRTDGQKVLVNLDMVQAIIPYGTGSRLYFSEADDYVEVTESQSEVALQTVR